MKRLKIVAQIILLILSVINFTLAAPIIVQGIREVRVDAVDVAEDVTTTSRKRWNPSDMWWTNTAGRANTPAGLGSSDPDHRLEQEHWPHDARSPMDPNASPQPSGAGPSQQSTGSDNPHPLPVGPPSPAHNNLPDLNASPQQSQEPADSDNSHESHPQALPEGPPPPAHNNLPDLNASPQSYQVSELTDGSDAGLYSSGDSTDAHSASSSPSYNYNPPPQHGNLDLNLNHPATPGLTDDQPLPASPSDPESSKRPYSPSDPGPSKRPYQPSDPGPSTSAHPPPDPEPSTWGPSLSDPGPSEMPYSPSDSGPSWSTWAHPPLDPGPSAWAYPPPDPGPSSWTNPPWDPTSHPPSDPTTHPPLSLGTVKQESEIYFSKLFEGAGKFKRRISGSRSVNAAQRELQGTLDSREYVSASASPLPPTFQLPCHKLPDFEFLQFDD